MEKTDLQLMLRTYVINPSVFSILLGIAAWEAATSGFHLIDPMFLPAPTQIGVTFVNLAQGQLGTHVALSLFRISSGFLLAMAVGVPLGILSFYEKWRKVIMSYVQMIQPIPPIVYLPILILWLGMGEESKIVVVVSAAVFPIIINTASAVRNVRKDYSKVAKMLGAKKRQIIQKVVFPSILPEIFTGFRVGWAVAWKTLIAAEMIAASAGLGIMTIQARWLYRADQVFVVAALIAVIGIVSDRAFIKLEGRLMPWRKGVVIQ